MKQPTLAAIDLGTNSCRLLIADRSGRTLYKNAISTRLGELYRRGGHARHRMFLHL